MFGGGYNSGGGYGTRLQSSFTPGYFTEAMYAAFGAAQASAHASDGGLGVGDTATLVLESGEGMGDRPPVIDGEVEGVVRLDLGEGLVEEENE